MSLPRSTRVKKVKRLSFSSQAKWGSFEKRDGEILGYGKYGDSGGFTVSRLDTSFGSTMFLASRKFFCIAFYFSTSQAHSRDKGRVWLSASWLKQEEVLIQAISWRLGGVALSSHEYNYHYTSTYGNDIAIIIISHVDTRKHILACGGTVSPHKISFAHNQLQCASVHHTRSTDSPWQRKVANLIKVNSVEAEVNYCCNCV